MIVCAQLGPHIDEDGQTGCAFELPGPAEGLEKQAVMPREFTRMLWRAPFLEIGRGGADPPVQGADRFVDDAGEGSRAASDRHIETLKLPLKFGEGFGHEADRHGGRDSDADVPLNLSRRMAHCREHFIVVVDQSSGLRQVVRAKLGQRHALRAAFEQARAYARLELVDAFRHGGSGDIQLPRGGRKAPGIGHGDERSQVFDPVHDSSRNSNCNRTD
ncbi:MAG: hypothetical protein AUG50_01000 [Betaproteobacteria bacterium 13_1_20CM_3_63_8]|nr:MAG: hypothetical protein AUG50_01000 [Betaproteobacteria bacterium 13_1_20CM_3_63_8]